MPYRFASSGTVATSRSASRAILALNVASNFLRDFVISVLHRLRQSRTLHTLTFGPIFGVHFRSHSSPSIARGSHARGWPRARQDRDRGECPRLPELVEPWPAALRRRRLLTVPPRTPAARRAQVLQRAFDLGNHSGRHAGVAGRRLQPLVSEQRLNVANVPAAREQMSREAVAKRMQRERLAQPRGFRGFLEQPAELTRGQRLMITATWKQPALFG